MKLNLPNHPKFRRLHGIMGERKSTVIGVLDLLWDFTAMYAIRGDIGRWSNEELADAMDWPGDAESLICALATARFIDVHPLHRYVIHNWCEHAPDWVKKRVQRQGLKSNLFWAADDEILPSSTWYWVNNGVGKAVSNRAEKPVEVPVQIEERFSTANGRSVEMWKNSGNNSRPPVSDIGGPAADNGSPAADNGGLLSHAKPSQAKPGEPPTFDGPQRREDGTTPLIRGKPPARNPPRKPEALLSQWSEFATLASWSSQTDCNEGQRIWRERIDDNLREIALVTIESERKAGKQQINGLDLLLGLLPATAKAL